MLVSPRIYERIKEKKKSLDQLRPLDKFQLKKLKEEFLIEYIYNSTSIEGNTLSLNETRLVLEEGVTIGGKSLREHLDVTNQKEAIEWIAKFIQEKKDIKEADILTLHRITLKGISDHWAGKYKTSQNRILGSKLKTTPPYKVGTAMNNLVHAIATNPARYNPLELAAFAHHELVKIHPFVDGNGRVARLMCNLILMRHGYPPVIIRVKDRNKYFVCLEKAHFENLKVFVDFMALMVEESFMRYTNIFAKATSKNALLPLANLAKGTPYSQEYLSLLARRGLLSATKIEGVWHSTKEDVQKYVESRSRQ